MATRKKIPLVPDDAALTLGAGVELSVTGGDVAIAGSGSAVITFPASSGTLALASDITVSKVGTPADNQIGVWTGDGTIEGDAGFTFDGGLNITVADAENKVGLTINQNDVTNNKNALVINTNVGALYTDTSQHALLLKSTDPGSIGPFIGFYHDSASPTTNDQIGGFGAFGKNSLGEQTNYGGFGVSILDTTDGSEDGVVKFFATTGGSVGEQMLSVNQSVNGIKVGANTAAGVVSSYGNQDLILQTGNATTGNITITDGANGNISLSPNGSGKVVVGTDLTISDAKGIYDENGNEQVIFQMVGSAVNYLEVYNAVTGGKPVITATGSDSDVGLTLETKGAGVIVLGADVETQGNIIINENTSIDLDGALSADGKYSGTCITGTAGAALAFGDVVYLAAADSRWELTDADAVGTAGTVLVGICVLAAAGDGSATKILLNGTIRADAKFPTLTISAPVYIDTATAGGVTVTPPSGADDVVRVLGFALTADSMYFNPSPDHITHTG